MSFFISLFSDNLVTICIFLVIFLLLRWYQRETILLPGPRGWPLVGNLFLLMKGNKQSVFRQLRAQYGDLVGLCVGSQPIVVVSGLDMLHQVFVDHAREFDKRPQVFTVLKIGKGKGVVHSSGEVWREHRAFLLANMNELGIAKTKFQENVIQEIQPFLQVLEATHGQDFDPQYSIQTAVSNIICSICFGKRFDYEDPQFKEILDIFEGNMKQAGGTALLNYFPFLERLPGDLFGSAKCLENVDKVQTMIKGWIERHESTLDEKNPRDIIDLYLLCMWDKTAKKQKTTMDEVVPRFVLKSDGRLFYVPGPDTVKAPSPNDFKWALGFERHLELNDLTDRLGVYGTRYDSRSDTQLLKFVGDLFVAGTETIATTLRWALVFLVRHPDKQEKIFQEILNTLGSRTRLCIQDKKAMPYTSAAILEVQRMGDIAPFSLPHSTFEPVRIGNFTIPAGAVVIPNVNSVHHDPCLWENPMEFQPSRFLDPQGNVVDRKELMPFFIGARMCPGRSLAKMEIFLVLTSIVQHFKILPSQLDGMPPLDSHTGVTHVPNSHELRFVQREIRNSRKLTNGY